MNNINVPPELAKTVNIPLAKGFTFSPTYLQAGAIVVLLFLLVLTLGQLRRRFLDWHIHGLAAGIFFGIIITVIVEGFLLVGGRTVITGLLGWKNPPSFLAHTLDSGRTKLVDVLGVQSEIPSSKASEKPTVNETVNLYNQLDPAGMTSFQELICTPEKSK